MLLAACNQILSPAWHLRRADTDAAQHVRRKIFAIFQEIFGQEQKTDLAEAIPQRARRDSQDAAHVPRQVTLVSKSCVERNLADR